MFRNDHICRGHPADYDDAGRRLQRQIQTAVAATRQRYKWTDGIAGSKGFPMHGARVVKFHHNHVGIKAWHPDVTYCAFKIF